MKQQINFNKIVRKSENKIKRMVTKPMTPQWRKVMENDIRLLVKSAGVHLYPEVMGSKVPAVAMPDGTYMPAW